MSLSSFRVTFNALMHPFKFINAYFETEFTPTMFSELS